MYKFLLVLLIPLIVVNLSIPRTALAEQILVMADAGTVSDKPEFMATPGKDIPVEKVTEKSWGKTVLLALLLAAAGGAAAAGGGSKGGGGSASTTTPPTPDSSGSGNVSVAW